MAAHDDDDAAGATLSEIEEQELAMDSTPHDHGRGQPPAVGAPRGPPRPQPVHSMPPARPPAAASRAGTPARPDSDSDSDRARRWPVLEICEGGRRFFERLQGPPLPDGRFEASSSSSSVSLSSGSGSASRGTASLNSLTWSETSLALGGPSLEKAKGAISNGIVGYATRSFQPFPGSKGRSTQKEVGGLHLACGAADGASLPHRVSPATLGKLGVPGLPWATANEQTEHVSSAQRLRDAAQGPPLLQARHPKSHKPPYLKHRPKSLMPAQSQAGPKSGCCLPLFLTMITHSIEGAVGVRVASTAAVEAGPGAQPGKRCSRALKKMHDEGS
ncbi:unnamed protein product [Symbiodinium microadriaticum]|nr:unnamed protein product [Symbiodinium microadriaticum]CAE7927053.1 unnamed protein product [Symbiodinium sp. KB8]